VWGAAKYFHPYLAEKDIDWDQALIKAIPRVESAQSASAYREAVDSMLSVLGDAGTRAHITGQIERPEQSHARPSGGEQPSVSLTDDQIAIVVANDWSQFAGSLAKAGAFRQALIDGSKAKAMVLDLRNLRALPSSGFWYVTAFLQVLPAVLPQDLALASTRYRMYSGYPTQTGGGYRGYYGAFVNADSGILRAEHSSGTAKPVAIVINSGSAGLENVLSGLQSARLATIIQDGSEALDNGGGFYTMQLTHDVAATIRSGEFVNPDGRIGFAADVVVPADPTGNSAITAALDIVRGKRSVPERGGAATPAVVQSRLEKSYPEMAAPSKEYRLLALFRLYHVITYFYPYKQLLDRSWDDVLMEYIPKLESAEGAQEYGLTIARLVSNLQDSHGAMRNTALQEYVGTHQPPLEVKSIEGSTVITHIFEQSAGTAGLSVGDVILAVDGEGTSERRERLAPLFAASTPQALRRRIDQAVLGGAKDSQMTLRVRSGSGAVTEVRLTRSIVSRKALRETPVYSVLPSGFGYIDLERLSPSDVDSGFEAVKHTPGLIFDIRGYPKGVFMTVAARLIDKETIAARFQTPTPQSPDPSEVSRVEFLQNAYPSADWKYHGKVVALINEEAISQSEHTCLFLEAAAHAKFVGTPTNGANGDVTQTVLPGGITVNFSGHDVRHADGRQLQRLGIQPDVRAEPTIEGIRAGRDEVLEKAVEYLKKN
jgi:C-terminal processing protease CtpA/Prc